MTRIRLGVLLVLFVTVLAGCGQERSTRVKSEIWRLLKVGSMTRAAANLPQDESYLFQSEAEFTTWSQRYGPDVPMGGVDFSKHTVGVLIRRYGAFEPMIKAVVVSDKTARVVLGNNLSKSNPIPSLPAGLEVRQYLVLEIPQVEAVAVVEEKAAP